MRMEASREMNWSPGLQWSVCTRLQTSRIRKTRRGSNVVIAPAEALLHLSMLHHAGPVLKGLHVVPRCLRVPLRRDGAVVNGCLPRGGGSARRDRGIGGKSTAPGAPFMPFRRNLRKGGLVDAPCQGRG